jgi:hypothetical protein
VIHWGILLLLSLSFSSMLNAKSVLYFGDSQSYGAMGTMMAQDLEKGDELCHIIQSEEQDEGSIDQVTLLAVVGSSPNHWGDASLATGGGKWLCEQTMKQYETGKDVLRAVGTKYCQAARNQNISVVEAAIQLVNPDLVVFQFLGNSAWFYQRAQQLPAEQREAYLQKTIKAHLQSILEPVGERQCLFISSNPTHISKGGSIIERRNLQEVFKRYVALIKPECQFLEGNTEESVRLLSHDPANYAADKVHMSAKGGRIFVDYIKSLRCQKE